MLNDTKVAEMVISEISKDMSAELSTHGEVNGRVISTIVVTPADKPPCVFFLDEILAIYQSGESIETIATHMKLLAEGEMND